MKRKLLYLIVLLVMCFSFDSCQKTCKTCKKVTYDANGNITSTGSEAEYCGAELLAIDGKTVDLGALGKSKWECN